MSEGLMKSVFLLFEQDLPATPPDFHEKAQHRCSHVLGLRYYFHFPIWPADELADNFQAAISLPVFPRALGIIFLNSTFTLKKKGWVEDPAAIISANPK